MIDRLNTDPEEAKLSLENLTAICLPVSIAYPDYT